MLSNWNSFAYPTVSTEAVQRENGFYSSNVPVTSVFRSSFECLVNADSPNFRFKCTGL